MDSAYLVDLLVGGLGGLLVVLAFQGILALRVYRLQLTVATIQQTLLTIKTQGAARVRWDKEDKLAQELQAFTAKPSSNGERFANDPIPY